MASQRCQHLVVDISPKLFGGGTERIQSELDKHGAAGWELVSVLQPQALHTIRLFFKRLS